MLTLFAQSVSTLLSATRSRLALTTALLVCCAGAAQAGPTGLLNDTRQTQCDNGGNAMGSCTIGNTGDAATYKRQDGRLGRDPAAPAKLGGGVDGFDFTRVCFNGDVQGAGNCTGALVQPLAFVEQEGVCGTAMLRSILLGMAPGATQSVQLDGTASIVFNGLRYTLVPDLTLSNTPADRVGQRWWQESATRYWVVNVQTPGTV